MIGRSALALLCLMAAAHAQTPVYESFLQTARAPDLVATTTPQNESLGLGLGVTVPVVYVCNLGPDNVWAMLGGLTVTVTWQTGILIPPAACRRLNGSGSSNIAVVANSDAGSTVEIMLGSGNP